MQNKESLKHRYTRDDLKILVEIIEKAVPKDVGERTAYVWGHYSKSPPIRYRNDLLKKDLERIVENKKDIRHFINKCCGKSDSKWLRVFLLEPIEKAPLFINDSSLFKQTIAKWRLKIAK